MKSTSPFTVSLASAALLLMTAAPAQAITLGAEVGVSADAGIQALSDTALNTNIQAKLAADSRIQGSSIRAHTVGRTVVLTGTAPSAEAKKLAEELALNVEGVSKVENQIEAPGVTAALGAGVKAGVKRTGKNVGDGWITTKVKGQLLADELTKASEIKVITKNKVVQLRGQAGSEEEKAKAIQLASAIQGVKRVDASRLKVSASASTN